MGFRQTLFPAFILISLFALSCERGNVGDTIDRVGESFSVEEQIIIGERIEEAINNNPSDFPILDKLQYENAYNYLQNNILDVIVKSPTMTKWRDFNWQVNIIDLDDKRHAFFLPNGKFFIHVELLKLLNNDAELLGIVAHELAYIEGDLILKNLKPKFGADFLSALADEKNVDENDLKEMASYFNKIEFESDEVLYADSFAVASICPFSYNSEAYMKILKAFDDESVGPFFIDWYGRKGSAEYIDRENKIEDFFSEHTECTRSGGVKRTEDYKNFKEEYLP